MKKKISVVLIIALILSLGAEITCVYGASLKEIESDISHKQKQLEKGKAKEEKLSKEIKSLEVKIGTSENKIEKLQGQIKKTETKIEKAKKDLKKSEKKVNTQNDNLNVRLRTMYKNGSVGFLDVLLGSRSISEFISNVDMVKKVYSSDKTVLGTLEKEYTAIEEKKNRLVALEENLEESKRTQAQEKKELSASKSAVSKKKSTVVAKNDALEDNIADLNAESDRIEAIIAANERKSNSSSGGSSGGGGNSGGGGGSSSGGGGNSGGGGGGGSSGKFQWPVPGHTRISSPYGWRNCPFHGREKHSGIDIPAPYGTRVVAASSGTVISAGYMGSYGNAVLISHGNGVYSLYAHNSSIVKWSGSVSKGQTISKVGSTGSSTGNHLHFEVRRGGSSYGNDVNPWNYL